MQCPQCQHENAAGQKFCGECGARLAFVCPACSASNLPTNKFCGECGAKLGASPPASAAGPSGAAGSAPNAAPSPPVASGTAPPAEPPGSRFATPESYTPKHLAEKILTSKSAVEGERKQVTVMFTDVSGFTAMSERLDPEEVHALMDRAFEVILAAVHGYEGTINQFLGDGVMALFGAPIAHEDHAGRALRAALDIQVKLAPIRADVQRMHGRDFLMRIGINTGTVVVGAIGRDLRMDYTALGDTVNLASRLLNVAQPGQIVVSRHTKDLCEGFFVFEDLGDFQLKGKTEPQRAFAVKSELGGRTRLEVSKERGLTPLLGRAAEREQLAELFRKAAGGSGAVVVIAGEPGVGKSRLLYEFLRGLDNSGHLEVETTCASFGRAMAYRPLVELYRRYFDLPEDLSPEDIRRRIAARLVALGVEGEEPALLLHHFLGVSVPPEFLQRVQGAQLRGRTHEILGTVIFRESALKPVVLIIENLHWIDDSSGELLKSLAARAHEHAVLLVLTTRPGSSTDWLPITTETLKLEGLTHDDIGEMVGTLCASRSVSEPLLELMVAKGGGNPLYVEEIVRQLQETEGILVEDGEARLRASDVTVPETIRDIIAARVDRLAESPKQTLQVASVVGRRFGVSLVSHVRETERNLVAGDLKDLHAVDFVFPSVHDPELMYSFKHALTQDVVYTSLLERRRRRFHAAAGRGLEELYAGRIDDVVEILAYHFGRGQVWDKAVTYQRQAAAKAQARSAHREAVACLEEALEALRHLPETPQTREQNIDVRLELRSSLYPLGEFEKMRACLREAETMASAISDSRRLGLVSYHTAEYFRQTGRFAEARALAEKALALGDKLQDVPLRLFSGHHLGLACHALGEYRRAAELLRTVAQSPQAECPAGAFRGTVSGSWASFQAITLAWLARCLAERGEFEEGVDAGGRAVALAEEFGSPYSLAAACIGLGYCTLVKGDLDAAGPVLERACRVAGEANLTLFRPQATRLLGATCLLAGRTDEGIAMVRAAAEEVESRRLMMQQAAVLALLGEACLFTGRVDEASNAAQRALSLAREGGQRGDAAAALHVLGEAAARGSLNVDEAEHYYLEAIALAGELEMRPLLARTHLGIGRLYVRASDRDRAEDHLLTATRLFITMDMPLWLRQAVSSLGELGRVLIVARSHGSLYEYLTRALGSGGPMRVVKDEPGDGPRIDDEERRPHIEEMLQSHGLSLTGSE